MTLSPWVKGRGRPGEPTVPWIGSLEKEGVVGETLVSLLRWRLHFFVR